MSTASTFQDVLQTRAEVCGQASSNLLSLAWVQSMQVQQDRRGQFTSQNSAGSIAATKLQTIFTVWMQLHTHEAIC